MFKNIKKAKTQLAQVNHYFDLTVDHLEENKNAYRAGVIGFGVGVALVSCVKARPVRINNVINVCAHAH